MTGSPCVSVVMTCYNGERFIGETIRAVLAQTFTDFELVIIDDCSSDGTVGVIERFDDPRIRLIRNNPNQGISNTRNIGLREARGRYLAAHDHDDISLPDRLAKEVAVLDADPSVVMVATGTQTVLHGKPLPVVHEYGKPPPVLGWDLMTRCTFVHSSVCYRLETLRRNDIFYDQSYHYAEDWELYIRLSDLGKIVQVPDVLVQYHLHGENNMLVHDEVMTRNGKSFLKRAYGETLGLDVTDVEIDRFWRLAVMHVSAEDRDDLIAGGEFLGRLVDAHIAHKGLAGEDERMVRAEAGALWWRYVAQSAKYRGPSLTAAFDALPRLATYRPSVGDRLKTLLVSNLRPPARALRAYFAS